MRIDTMFLERYRPWRKVSMGSYLLPSFLGCQSFEPVWAAVSMNGWSEICVAGVKPRSSAAA